MRQIRQRFRHHPAVLTAILIALDLPGFALEAGPFSAGVQVGQIKDKRLAELSGIVASRGNPGVLWVHNDRARDQIYAVSTNGQLLATWSLDKTVDDLEDIAIGPGPLLELQYLYCADIGDNAAARASIRVFRAGEPSVYPYQAANPPSPRFPEVERITLVYPDGSHNAEALMVDPWTGDLFIATKQPGRSRVYRAQSAQLKDGANVTLSFLLELDFDIVSAGDISPDGRSILLRQEEFARLWRRVPDQTLGQALEIEPSSVPVIGTPTEPNGEAIAFAADDTGYYTVSEGADPPIYYFPRTTGVSGTTTRILIPPASIWKFNDDGSDQGTAWRTADFNDAEWRMGPAQIGYGEADEQTVIRFGPDRDRKQVTTYFRRQFQGEEPGRLAAITVRLVYDDGIAVYLNGAELLRRDLAPAARFSDAALSSGSSKENVWQSFSVTNLLIAGTNTIAVEVHRYSPSEGDLSFDLQLIGTEAGESLKFIGTPRRASANTWSFDFQGPGEVPVFLETSANLRDWTTLDRVPAQNGSGTVALETLETLWRFYRLRQ